MQDFSNRVRVQRGSNKIEIIVDSKSMGGAIFLLIFSGIFGVVTYFLLLSPLIEAVIYSNLDTFDIIRGLFAIPFVSVTLFLFYLFLISLFNKEIYTVSDDGIKHRGSPFPTFGVKTFSKKLSPWDKLEIRGGVLPSGQSGGIINLVSIGSGGESEYLVRGIRQLPVAEALRDAVEEQYGLGGYTGAVPENPQPTKANTPIPKGMEVKTGMGELTIIKDTRSALIGGLVIGVGVFFSLFFVIGFVIPIFGELWNADDPNLRLILLAFLPFGLAILYIFYFGIAQILNKRTVIVKRDRVITYVEPLSFLISGKVDVPIGLEDQLFVKKERYRSSKGRTRERIVLKLLHRGRERDLMGWGLDPDFLFYMEKLIEDYVGIKDEPVPGELSQDLSKDPLG